MNVELLYPLITEAILRAETLEDLGAPGVYSAYLDLSLLEERVAGILPASDPEGALARRGAVRAALAAKEAARAQQLAARFLAENDVEDALRVELRRFSEQAELGMKTPVTRFINQDKSRKFYDTGESRYVSLDEIAGWVRAGQDVRVVDNATGADVTSQALTQIILDEGRRGTPSLPDEFLHDLIRMGELAVNSGLEQVQQGVDRLAQASKDRLGPVRRAREEMSSLRVRLEQLESSLAELEKEQTAAPNAGNARGTSTAPPRRELRRT